MERFKGDICVSLCHIREERPQTIQEGSLETLGRLFTELRELVGICFFVFFLNDEFTRLLRSSVTWRLFGIDELVS